MKEARAAYAAAPVSTWGYEEVCRGAMDGGLTGGSSSEPNGRVARP